ncbi:ATP-dependent DNA helicase [Lachnellula suecica]|uniref:ATP-dependent DNA helicase n=1 Tax=Lachnellula suecica TaxID=602035 RepID=A0A8T9BXQ1_9HELO|nr:ATP-dependent DNA helicase [Lachnellula suecica]
MGNHLPFGAQGCRIPEGGKGLTWGEKWAFKSKVWKELNLRHVKLEQIHRQKDSDFQDILNKIRNGIQLSTEDWQRLECPKVLPPNAFAVRLMSRLAQVKSFNEEQLKNLRPSPKLWRANDACIKLRKPEGGFRDVSIPHKIKEYTESLRDHRLLDELTLKVGARIVLLHNLMPGLVNGSQGVVVGFKPAVEEQENPEHQPGDHKSFRSACMQAYKESNGKMRPLVRFNNHPTPVLIPAIAAASIRGGAQPAEQYVVCRTQIPLTLAWALSIHKSQGMTLEYVEVSSKDIFESGQLYVALSRATRLDGLRLTGFQRQQLPMDKDVLEFYTSTKWENLQGRGRKKKESTPAIEDMET